MAAVEVPPFLPLLPHPWGVGIRPVVARSLRPQLLVFSLSLESWFGKKGKGFGTCEPREKNPGGHWPYLLTFTALVA